MEDVQSGIKEKALSVIKEGIETTGDIRFLRWCIANNVFKDDALRRVKELLGGAPYEKVDHVVLEAAQYIVTDFFEPEDEEKKQGTTARWALKRSREFYDEDA